MVSFETVKESVSAPDIWRAYGGTPISRGFVKCIHHADKRPSMRLYDGNKGYYCFSCGNGGDSIKLASCLLGISPIETVKQINTDFGLNLDLKKPDDAAYKKVIERREKIKAFDEWYTTSINLLSSYHRMLYGARKQITRQIGEEIPEIQIEALHQIESLSWMIDQLESDPMCFYKVNREYVEKVKRRMGEIADWNLNTRMRN